MASEPDLAITGEDGVGVLHASPGVVCSHLAAVPVITVGRHDADHVDLAAALERRARQGDGLVAHRVDEALQSYADRTGLGPVAVRLVRRGGTERIEATVPAGTSSRVRADLAVRLLAAAEATGRHSMRRDVAVTCADGGD